jgi:hypothetical protein
LDIFKDHIDRDGVAKEQAGAVAFADMLKVNKALKELDISRNLIGTVGAKAFASMLEVNTTLKTFNL